MVLLAHTNAPWEVTILGTTVERAIRIGKYLIPHARAAFAEMGADAVVGQAKTILRWIEHQNAREFTKRQVHQAFRGRFKRVEELDAPLELLRTHGYIASRPTANTGPGRKPSPKFEVNPLWLYRRTKARIQHPGVHERTDRGGSNWYFRYWDDVLQPDGATKAARKFHTVGPSKGETRLSKKQAEVERDRFLATINKPTIQEKVVDGLVLFSKMVEKYRAAHVEAEVAGRFLLAKPTRAKYIIHLEQRIVPKWGTSAIAEWGTSL
jgi:hypothetical protein